MSTLSNDKPSIVERVVENVGLITIMGLVFAAAPLLAAWSVKGLIQIF
ncbi:MAG: hypothetical protein HQL63_00160 [Magnetococcales bacterium]|nr:hypothetical protein [Magnetococcales bacterium]